MSKIYSIVLIFFIFLSCAHRKEEQNPSIRKKIVEKVDANLKEMNSSQQSNIQLGRTPYFVIYETEPLPLPGNRVPKYTDFARSAGVEGRVSVRAEIFVDGSVGAVEIVKSLQSGQGGLDEQVIKTVKTWKFIPAKNQGKPVAVWVTFPIDFRL